MQKTKKTTTEVSSKPPICPTTSASLAIALLLSLISPATGTASPVVVTILGQSNAQGYAKPYPCSVDPSDLACDDIPQNARYIRNGSELTAYDARFSGVEVGLLECLTGLGYEPVVVTRAGNGILMSSLLANHVPSLISDMDSFGFVPNAVVVIHGEQDSRVWGSTMAYFPRLQGPAYEASGAVGHQDPNTGSWVAPNDISIAGQLRARWPSLPFIVTEVRTRDNRDLPGFHLGDEVSPAGAATYPHHDLLRASQAWGCARMPACFLVETGHYATSVASDLHYSSQGFWDLGWDLCVVVDQWVLQSFPPTP